MEKPTQVNRAVDRAALRREQILQQIRDNGGRVAKGELQRVLGIASVYPDLQTLRAEGKIVKVAHGSYALAGVDVGSPRRLTERCKRANP